ncbi:MAG: zinc ribbon domain-containing protein [Clostridia bacterium]|nr:zinc ribbon domain-containing protein [Clostridia bacterium]
MFCPKCGNVVPDGASFCPSCQSQLVSDQPTAPNAVAPAKIRGVKKADFIANEASEKVKKASKLAYIACLCAAVFLVISIIVVNNMAVYNIPFVSMLVEPDDISDFKEASAETLELIEDAQDELDELEEELDLDDSDIKVLDNYIDKAKKAIKTPSLASFKATVKAYEGLFDIDTDDDSDHMLKDILDPDFFEEIHEITEVCDIILIVFIVFAVIVILIALLAAHFKRTGLAVFAAILATPFTIFMAGFIWFVLVVGCLVALAVMCATVNKEYKGK